MQNTFVIILDKEAADFVAGRSEAPNDYLNRLLRQEMVRQRRSQEARPGSAELVESAPDTSGYPEMKGTFRD